jgi:hypothetical protein
MILVVSPNLAVDVTLEGEPEQEKSSREGF